jgi:hypothetical protein
MYPALFPNLSSLPRNSKQFVVRRPHLPTRQKKSPADSADLRRSNISVHPRDLSEGLRRDRRAWNSTFRVPDTIARAPDSTIRAPNTVSRAPQLQRSCSEHRRSCSEHRRSCSELHRSCSGHHRPSSLAPTFEFRARPPELRDTKARVFASN